MATVNLPPTGGGGEGAVSSVSNVDGTISISPTVGDVVASLPSSGVTAGAYEVLGATVDSQGRITAATEKKPSVIAMSIIFG